MIARVSSSLIQEIDRLLIELHVFAFEPQIANPRHFLLSIAKIVGEKEGQLLRRVEQGAFHGDILDFGGLR